MNDMLDLDPTQRSAATDEAQTQLTLAGPGSGKTTTLAARFVHLVRQGVDPRRILALTFTKKAAEEMQSRIVGMLGLDGAKGLAIGTVHGFAFRHLRQNPEAAGLADGFALWNNLQQRRVFHARRMWWNEELDILEIIGGLKERLIDAAGFEHMVREKPDELPAFYASAVTFFNFYEAALRDAGAIDFADMVPLLTRAMARDADYRRRITGAFDHILVDEYQDVNPGQLDLISHFTADGVKLWAVGDDDQTLYAFRASDIRTILEFGRRYASATIHVLDRNYRSCPAIVATAKTLIRHNLNRVGKDYQPVVAEPGEIIVRGYASPELEARRVADAIAELIGSGYAPRQLAVLYRAGAIGLNFQTALQERQIPFEVRGSGDLWQSTAAQLVVGSLHYLDRGATVEAMSRLGAGKRGRIVIERLDEIRPTVGRDFHRACTHVRRIVGEAMPGKAAERERNEWASLVQSVVTLAAACASLAALERRIAEQSAALRKPPEHAVVLSTVHSAKGLEWDAVFLVGMEDGVLPSANAEDVEEERRVAYVGLTRARRLLGLTYCAERFGASAKPSRFLFEIRQAGCCVWSGPRAEAADERLPLATEAERKRLQSPGKADDRGPDVACSERSSRRKRRPITIRTNPAKVEPQQRLQERIERNVAAGLPPRYGLPWLQQEQERLGQLFNQLIPLDRIARALQRNEGGVLAQLVQLKMLPAENPGAAFETYQRTRGHPELAGKL